MHDQVRDKLAFAFEDLGEQQVKNIARPVRVYRVRDRGVATDSSRCQPPPPLPLPDKPSIAVLPFANMSGDPEQEFFADGIAEDIITALSRYPSLFVIARNSSFTYKGRAVDVKQVGRELGVRYVLEGSVRKVRQPHPRHRAADRGRDRQPCLGRALRPRSRRHFRGAGRDHRGGDDRHRPGHCRRRAATRDAQAAGKPRRLGRLSARVVAFEQMSLQRTTLSQRSSFSRPSISTRTLPEATRASPRFKRNEADYEGRGLPETADVREKHWRAGPSHSIAPMRKPVHYSLSHSVGAATTKAPWPRPSGLWQ